MEISKVLWLSEEQVKSVNLSTKEVIDAVEEGFKLKAEKKVKLPSKIGVHPRANCFIHAMPCLIKGDIDTVGVKWISGYPSNTDKGVPYINGTILINDSETGLLKAVIGANRITAWRTGAATGLCARYMAKPDTEIVAVIGLGVEGTSNLLALKEVLPKIKIVKIYDISKEQIMKYEKNMSSRFPGVSFISCKDTETTVQGADIIVTCTPIIDKPKRFIHSSWLKKDVLAIAVDYDSAFDADIMTGGKFICDDKNQYLKTQRETNYFQNGYPSENQIYADMGEIVSGIKESVKKGVRGAVLMGLASHDIMTGWILYKKALEKGIGTWLKR